MKIKYNTSTSRENYKLRVGFDWSVNCRNQDHCTELKRFLDSAGIDYTYIRRSDTDHSFFLTEKNAEYFKIVTELDQSRWAFGSYMCDNTNTLYVTLMEIV